MHTLPAMSIKYFYKAYSSRSGSQAGMNIRKYDNQRKVGADRIVNAVAAYEKYGGPTNNSRLGTAITFCAVSEEGEDI